MNQMIAVSDLQLARISRDYARLAIRDLIQRAFDAGQNTTEPRPSAQEVNEAIKNLERVSLKYEVELTKAAVGSDVSRRTRAIESLDRAFKAIDDDLKLSSGYHPDTGLIYPRR